MTQAYHNLGIYNVPIIVTNLYVRFKPASIDQLAILDSTTDAQNLELFDTPVDYDVTYEGDYYQDPSIPDEQITWQYAVVPPNFVFHRGIQYEILAQIHIPGDNYTAVETEAERLASGGGTAKANGTVRPYLPSCPPGYHWDTESRSCVQNTCPAGSHLDPTGTFCVPDQVQPPSPAVDAAVPAGNIYVFDTNLPTFPVGSNVAVRKARVVARRWFKIERTYTDDNGNYVFTKKFKDKVRILVKFKNDNARVSGMRGIRLWQMLFAVKKTLGIFSGDKSHLPTYTAQLTPTFGYIIGVGQVDITASNKSTRFWAAATTLNSVQEYRDYAPQEGIGLPPTNLRILLSSWGNGSSSSPLFHKRFFDGLIKEFVLTFLATTATPIAGGVTAVLTVLKREVDIVISYNVNITRLTSDFVKGTAYHELTHAAHYQALGIAWYRNFVDKEFSEIVSNFLNSTYSPYGGGNNSYSSPVIALEEGWAYYMGHYLADKTYLTQASCQTEQKNGSTWCNGNGTNHPHLDVEENFNPNLSNDPFHWIPQGLFYDLWDNRNDFTFDPTMVNDQVFGYTNRQMFNAFQSDVYSLQDYRIRLLQQNNNNQSAEIINLFSQYHY